MDNYNGESSRCPYPYKQPTSSFTDVANLTQLIDHSMRAIQNTSLGHKNLPRQHPEGSGSRRGRKQQRSTNESVSGHDQLMIPFDQMEIRDNTQGSGDQTGVVQPPSGNQLDKGKGHARPPYAPEASARQTSPPPKIFVGRQPMTVQIEFPIHENDKVDVYHMDGVPVEYEQEEAIHVGLMNNQLLSWEATKDASKAKWPTGTLRQILRDMKAKLQKEADDKVRDLTETLMEKTRRADLDLRRAALLASESELKVENYKLEVEEWKFSCKNLEKQLQKLFKIVEDEEASSVSPLE
ncbi:uncharacterized protein LY89DRAFT_776010 [Mollisia scopiformis]|uniref:Uncharacterized protein n=1 Tax=Mollisia scopiformis TaxID=149040 RepID=A0A194XTW0_MOLSC|nr:uncharacterized protein LY89DRAFT_776010 [Mollisia scopiformis]KUJ23760.1 hypothetical protein LY89DRAFT_776010 [Mollisia scopiformis]